MSRGKPPKDPRGGHARLYWTILDSPAWRTLTHADVRVYLALRRKLGRTNNGDINATLAEMKHAGISSSSTLSAALHRLEALGFIEKTRQGGIAHGGNPMRQHVPIMTSECNFGGVRYWFGCPRCGRRVAVLYLRARGFACRGCNRIAYASQSGDEIDRTWRKQAKLEQLLGDHWRRPKGMHSSTYDRIVRAIGECEERRNAAFVLAVRRLGLTL